LFAVGRTGLQWKWVDLSDRGRFGARWRLCDLPAWARLLDELDGLPSHLTAYRDRVLAERSAQEAAVRFVNGDGPAPRNARDCDRLLSWAWLSELCGNLDDRGSCWCSDQPNSGPVIYIAPSRVQLLGPQGGALYLDIMSAWRGRDASELVIKG